MDELYENLENYNEETTLSELRDENKELKLKLEEYTSAFEKLQKDFDTLSKEHRQLEINFSSLLKTAKAEIERKTQMITKLNIEKDQMVLNSIQNGNGPYHRRRNNQTKNWDTKPSKEPVNCNTNKKLSIDNQASKERTSKNSPKDNFNTAVNTELPCPPPRSNLQTRLLDMVNKSVGGIGVSSTKAEAKENIQLNKTARSSARISSRRKSMSAFRIDSPRFSPEEDEVANTGSGREIIYREPETTQSSRFHNKPYIENRSDHEPSRDLRTKVNKYDSDKPKSQERYDTQKYKRYHSPDRRYHPERRGSPDRRRLSPENRKISTERRRGSPERRMLMLERRRASPHKRRDSAERRKLSPDRRRVSPDRRRVSPDRRRQSPNRRRSSPDRHMKGFRDHSEELRHKQEYDRHRRLVSPPRNKYLDQKHQSREVQSPLEVLHTQDFDKSKSRSQDRYAMKHKMSNDYEEPCKRVKLDSHHQIEERNTAEPDFSYLQHDMSCQSPEFNNLEAHPSHQIREIKLYATTQLEDPRRSSNRYVLNVHTGKPMLTSVKNDNIDLKVIDKSGWDIIEVKMPDALLERPNSSALASNLLQNPVPLQLSKSFCGVSTDKALETNSHPDNSLPEAQAFNLGALSERVISPTFKHQKTSPKIEIEPVQKAVTSDMPDILQEHSSHYNDTPDTAPQTTMSTDDIVNEIYMDIDNPISNMSESGEIYDDLDGDLSYEPTENTVKEHTKCMKDSQAVEHCKDAVLSDKRKTLSPMVKRKNSTRSIKKKLTNETSIDASKKEDNNPSQSTTTQPCSNDVQKELQNYASSKEIIGDFDLSDDEGTSDNTDIQKQTNTVLYIEQESGIVPTSDIKSTSKELKFIETLPNSGFIQGKSNVSPQDDEAKTKKKSHKHKYTQKLPEIEDSVLPPHMPVKAIETSTKEQFDDSSLTIDELVKLRDNLIKGLENKETPVSNEKLMKKKETKTSPENKEPEPPVDKSTIKINELVKLRDNLIKGLENKETPLSNEKLKKRKETKTSPENKEPKPPVDKSTIKNENLNRGFKDKETPVSNEKSVKKKEAKTKTAPENKELIPPTDKSAKKKETKTKETKYRTKATSGKKDKPVADEPLKDMEIKKVTPDHKNTYKQRKKKQIASVQEVASAPLSTNYIKDKAKATKFTELFGDSSSLVSPEELGLVPTIIAQDNYVAMSEDAQDATDIAAIKAAVSSITTESTEIDKADTQTKCRLDINSGDTPVISEESITPNQETVSEELAQSAASNQSSLYQNLQPGLMEKDNHNVKTVIISSGVQPQFISEVTESNSVPIDRSEDLHVMQCVKPTVFQGLGMQALATSTPHKPWEKNVQFDIDPMTSTSKYISHESRDTSVDKTPAINNSDNTNNSQVNDEPDMKIFIKRRKKVLKKK